MANNQKGQTKEFLKFLKELHNSCCNGGFTTNVNNKDIEITDSTKGVILTSPNGTRYRIAVNNAGTLSTAVVS